MTFHDVGQFVILRIRRLMKSFIKFIQSICAVAHSSRSSRVALMMREFGTQQNANSRRREDAQS